jgi:hypothetical protein
LRKTLSVTALALVLSATNVDAASFNCGRWMCKRVGIANCGSLALALEWARKFPRTSARPGAVLVQTRKGRALGGSRGGHVSKVVALTDKPCRVIVQDNRGRYERDHCRNFVAFVSVGGMWTE